MNMAKLQLVDANEHRQDPHSTPAPGSLVTATIVSVLAGVATVLEVTAAGYVSIHGQPNGWSDALTCIYPQT